MRTEIKTIWCDVCDNHEDFSAGEYSYREYMTSNGWTHTKGKDVCPDCMAKYNKLMESDKLWQMLEKK